MNTMKNFAISTITAVALLGLGGCSSMSSRDKSTAVGAGVGAVAGAVLSGGRNAETRLSCFMMALFK